MSTFSATTSQRFSNLFRIEFMFKYEKIMLPIFFDFKLRKWDKLENELTELIVRLRNSPLSFSFMSQTEFTTFEKFLISKEVLLLFKCNLDLFGQVLPSLWRRIFFPYFLRSNYIILDILCSSMNSDQIRLVGHNQWSNLLLLQEDFSVSLNCCKKCLVQLHTWSSNCL